MSLMRLLMDGRGREGREGLIISLDQFGMSVGGRGVVIVRGFVFV
jgi:hypothetical protein